MPHPSSHKLNIADVAKAAGVSTTTVSRVINRIGTVKESNRARVLDAIRKMKYRPNPSAQRLAAGKNNTIGLVIPRFQDMFHSFYITELMRGVGTASERLKLDLLLHITDGPWTNMQSVEGLLFADLDGSEELVDAAVEQGIPCVIMNHFLEELPVSCVAVDNRKAAREVVRYLAELGHQEIATITGHLRTHVGIERLDGYLAAIKERKLPMKEAYVEHGDFGAPSAREPAKRLLGLKDRPTAIFAASDAMAVETIEVAFELGLRVPEDLSVVGFDDSPVAAFGRVPLTTVWQPLSGVGEQSVEILHDQIDGKVKSPIKRLLPTQIIKRQSCRQTWLER
ncbi:MAG: LacI family DNA-binding transcriptional regulator [Candidatus Omnitrophica bacterium]|nr:LacI family DNA-binding transcriptional regulator [Candidatus Omnitrophota bacterium]